MPEVDELPCFYIISDTSCRGFAEMYAGFQNLHIFTKYWNKKNTLNPVKTGFCLLRMICSIFGYD